MRMTLPAPWATRSETYSVHFSSRTRSVRRRSTVRTRSSSRWQSAAVTPRRMRGRFSRQRSVARRPHERRMKTLRGSAGAIRSRRSKSASSRGRSRNLGTRTSPRVGCRSRAPPLAWAANSAWVASTTMASVLMCVLFRRSRSHNDLGPLSGSVGHALCPAYTLYLSQALVLTPSARRIFNPASAASASFCRPRMGR